MKIIITEQQYNLLMKQNINEDFLNWYGENVEKLIDILGNLMNKMGVEKFLDKYGEFVEKVFGSISEFFKKLRGKDSINENYGNRYSTVSHWVDMMEDIVKHYDTIDCENITKEYEQFYCDNLADKPMERIMEVLKKLKKEQIELLHSHFGNTFGY